ncbi:MAG TPA: hypothetical protein V6D28_25190 [Leptolyngbyaceae cyanobacterium]
MCFLKVTRNWHFLHDRCAIAIATTPDYDLQEVLPSCIEIENTKAFSTESAFFPEDL